MGAARQAIEAAGLDAICDMLADGLPQRTIAQRVGCKHSTLNEWLQSLPPDQTARVNSAKEQGAEAYEVEAQRILADTYDLLNSDAPHPNGSALAGLAKERAQAAWRMATLRSVRYGESRRIDQTVTHTHTVQHITTAELERIAASALTLTLDPETGEAG